MTTLDDLARVERELRCMADALGYSAGDWIRGNAGTIAEYIAAQRERDADNAKLREELAAAKAEVEQSDAEYQDAVTLAKSNLDRFQAAQAACGQMREALMRTQSALREVGNDYPGSSCFTWCHARADEADAALSTDAGKGWVDATGAVEAIVREYKQDQSIIGMPGSWAGRTVLVMVKP